MSLYIKVFVNTRLIAEAKVSNVSNLAPVSDYEGVVTEKADLTLGTPKMTKRFRIQTHARKQSVWALVKRVAEAALEKDEK